MSPEEDDKYTTNLLYLEAHGLIDSGLQQAMDGDWMSSGAKITARDLDFLADDGGLTAILGTVTVKPHDDTIAQSDLTEEEKRGLLHPLKELRGEALKHLTIKVLDAGLENAPKALPMIQKFLEDLVYQQQRYHDSFHAGSCSVPANAPSSNRASPCLVNYEP